MVIVVSNPTALTNEAQLINTLFEEGLQIFHLRKPAYSKAEVKFLLKEVHSRHTEKIVLHTHHELATMFGISRLHYPEQMRNNSNNDEWVELNKRGCILSTSIHDIKEIEMLNSCFEYTFFGPVFDSISKQGYKTSLTNNFEIKYNKVKIIAIGGIEKTRIETIKKIGFTGIAALGTIWQSIHPIDQFKQLQKAWNDR